MSLADDARHSELLVALSTIEALLREILAELRQRGST